MNEFLLFCLVYLGFGLAVTAAYALLYRARPKLRHILAWPLINAFLFWGYVPPKWLAPHPEHVAANARMSALRNQVRSGHPDPF